MFSRKQLLQSKEYWMVKIQTQLFAQLENFLTTNKMTRTQFAEKLGVSKGYVSQVLNGDFNHSISKLIELSLAIGKVPIVHFEDIEQCVLNDEIGLRNYSDNTMNQITIKIEIKYQPNMPVSGRSFDYNKDKNSTPQSYNNVYSNYSKPKFIAIA